VAPLSTAEATAAVRSWLARPQVSYLQDSPRHIEVALGFLEATGSAANLTTDAQIAAHAWIAGATVFTRDTDFRRFPQVRAIDPLKE
jgi:predicted nucleic acid-binding protein